jgi:putative two-component system response regulator
MSDITILIVDDEPTILASMSKILAPEYRVRAANSGFRALEVAKSEPRPALILLDSMMPDMDGYTVLSLLKKNVATRDIPVIFVTGMKTVADEEKGLRLGAVDYITKPINPSILLARVKTHYDTAKARKLLMQLMSLLKVDDAAASELFGESKNLLINAYGPIVEILGQQIMKLDNKAARIQLASATGGLIPKNT